MASPIVRARLSGLAALQTSLASYGSGRCLSAQTAAAVSQAERPESASSEATKPAVAASYRTFVADPAKHTEEHLAKFYSVPKNLQTGLFNIYKLNKKTQQLHKLIDDFSIMVRAPFLEIREYIRNYDLSKPALRVMLYGRLGTGKSHTMAHLVHYAFSDDWLIISNHWLPEWIKRPKETQPSEVDPALIDNPLDAAVWLQHFRIVNAGLLERLNLPTTKEWTWSDTETTAKGEPLVNIIEHGTKRVKHACKCVDALFDEIRVHTDAGRTKTFVAVEGVNIIWETSFNRRVDRSFIPVEDFTLLRSFKKVLSNDWKNAVVVVTVDEGALSLKHRNLDLEKVPDFMPQYLLGKRGFEFFEPFLPVRTENYNEKEMESVLDYYTDKNFIQHPQAKTEAARDEFKFLSGYNPRELMKLCQWI